MTFKEKLARHIDRSLHAKLRLCVCIQELLGSVNILHLTRVFVIFLFMHMQHTRALVYFVHARAPSAYWLHVHSRKALHHVAHCRAGCTPYCETASNAVQVSKTAKKHYFHSLTSKTHWGLLARMWIWMIQTSEVMRPRETVLLQVAHILVLRTTAWQKWSIKKTHVTTVLFGKYAKNLLVITLFLAIWISPQIFACDRVKDMILYAWPRVAHTSFVPCFFPDLYFGAYLVDNKPRLKCA